VPINLGKNNFDLMVNIWTEKTANEEAKSVKLPPDIGIIRMVNLDIGDYHTGS